MHFCVTVVGFDYEDILEPFNQESMEYVEFEEFVGGTKDAIEEFTKDLLAELRTRDSDWDRKLLAKYEKYYREGKFDELIRDWNGAEYDEDEGAYGAYFNPNAEWDWYEVGGRWRGFFIKKSSKAWGELGDTAIRFGKREFEYQPKNAVDILKVKDIDWEAMRTEKIADREVWWKNYLKCNKGDGKTKKEFMEDWTVDLSSYAIVMGGEWITEDNFLHYSVDGETWSEFWLRTIKQLDPEEVVVSVDCHM